jgi:hypothetical protein
MPTANGLSLSPLTWQLSHPSCVIT